jgi:hypothetical protein
MPMNEYVEVHNGGYYIAGTRVGLDVVTYDFRRGRSAEAIFEAYPSIGSLAIGSLAKVYGAIAFVLQRPMPADMIERFERIKNERSPNALEDRFSS